ncbi:MAG: SRPBCC family protein [Actinomycetota bacterium]
MKVLRFETSVAVTSEAPPQVVYDTIADLKAHLDWAGERASDDDFKLLALEVPDGPVHVGTAFTSTGANFNGTFHDRSVVTEASPPSRFAIETDARLDRKRGKPWEVRFRHRYDIEENGDGSRIVYTDTTLRMNYVPYWLRPWMRPLTRAAIHKADTKQLGNLARLAEERAGR